jgi:DNA polymerase V
MNYIGVIDCNNFFVSCERLFRPDLVGRPVVVLSSNDGCVVARSQEVKDMGVVMGVPIFQIKDIVKDKGIVTFSSHFALYRDLSARVFAVVKTLLPVMEIYSIDEAFFAIKAESKQALEQELMRIKREVERQVGIPVSLGVAATKTQAKYANKLAKKAGGVMVLTPADWQSLISTLPLRDIWGVGGRLGRRYSEAGMITVADLLSAPKPRLQPLFGISGLRLQAELHGESVYLLGAHSGPQKSIMSSRSFAKNVTDRATVHDAVAYHVRSVVADLRRLGLKTIQLSVYLGTSRHGDYVLRGGSLAVDLDTPTDDMVVLLKEASRLLDRLYEADVPYKKAGVYIGPFVPKERGQQSLFTPATPPPSEALNEVVDVLNNRFGIDMVAFGRHTKVTQWQSKSEKKSPAYTTRWNELAVARA